MKKLLFIGLILMCCSLVYADTGVDFLNLETGAGPIGMGGAYTAYTAEPYAAAFNPAAIFGINSLAGSFGHDTYWNKRRFESGFVSFKKGPIVYNLGLRFVQVSDIKARQYATINPDYYFDSNNLSLKFAGAFKINQTITAGLSAGWVFEKISMYRDHAFSVDLGLIVEPRSDLSIGLSVLNLGTKMNLDKVDYSIPTTLRFGAVYSYKNFKPAVDFVYLDKKMYAHLGGEYKIKDILFLRAGYRIGYDSKDISAGAGFVHRNIRVDYAFLPYNNKLGESHTFSLNFTL